MSFSTYRQMRENPNTPISPVSIQDRLIVPFPRTLLMWTEFRGPGFGNYTAWRMTDRATGLVVSEGAERTFNSAIDRIARTRLARKR